MKEVSWHHQARSLSSRTIRDVYIPHPAPDAAGNEDEEKAARMGATWSLLKTLIIPAIISLILYLFISYLIVPIWKRYRGRYSNYLPLDSISNRTTSFRQRAQSAVADFLVPSAWRRERNMHAVGTQDGAGSDFDDDEGEELSGFDENRREALSLDASRGRDDDGRRLSRDLEEGFKDDSDDSDDDSDALADTRSRSISR